MNLADTGFVIIASTLVWFMTPGLAFFYGGLVSKRNVINTMLSVFYITGIAILLWVAVGYELSFNGDLPSSRRPCLSALSLVGCILSF